MGRKAKNFRDYYIQDIHLEHTFRITFRNYISTHIRIIFTFLLLSVCPLVASFTPLLASYATKFNPQAPYLYPLELHYNFIIITFIIYNIIILKLHYNYTHNLVAHLVLYPLHVSLHFTYIYNIHYNYTQKFHSYIHFSLPSAPLHEFSIRITFITYIRITLIIQQPTCMFPYALRATGIHYKYIYNYIIYLHTHFI